MTNESVGDGEETIEPTVSLDDENSQLQREVEKLQAKLKKATKRPSGKIGVIFLVLGAISLILSMFNIKELLSQTPFAPFVPSITGNTQTLAFVGLGLVLWGGLFILARPVSYVRSSLLEATAISLYATIDRIKKDLKYNSKSYYIPPFPKEVYIPEHLKGLKEMIVFISANDEDGLPAINEIAEGRFLLDEPKGMTLTPPGLGLVEYLEEELMINFTRMSLEDLCELLPKVIPEDLQLAKGMAMEVEGKLVHLNIVGSIYKSLCYEKEIPSVHLLGSPLVSAIACAIAKTTGKPVTIQDTVINSDTETIDVTYQIIDV